MRIGIIFGGKSSEHEVSKLSAASLARAINHEKYDDVALIGIGLDGRWRRYCGRPELLEQKGTAWMEESEVFEVGILRDVIDFAFPIVHGAYGEDGKIQGLFELLDIPYAGSGVLGSACCMDKAIAKELFKSCGLPTAEYRLLSEGEELCESELEYPCFVKPVNTGSSIGISKVKRKEELSAALELAFSYDKRAMIERAVNARELEIGVIGNSPKLETSVVGEILHSSEFYDYEAKYENGGAELRIPAEISNDDRLLIAEYAKRAYAVTDCAGFARIDFFKDRDSGKILINEINTIPGFTAYSMVPRLFAAKGLAYPELIDRITALGIERYLEYGAKSVSAEKFYGGRPAK